VESVEITNRYVKITRWRYADEAMSYRMLEDMEAEVKLFAGIYDVYALLACWLFRPNI
jgi:hypothetical protein